MSTICMSLHSFNKFKATQLLHILDFYNIWTIPTPNSYLCHFIVKIGGTLLDF